ncbi:MAG: efflux RND transporter periplasmic adaptor subunit [Cyanobacteria bacterium P01_H01_bin.74]
MIFSLALTGCKPYTKEEPVTTVKKVSVKKVSGPKREFKRVFSGVSKVNEELLLSFRVNGQLKKLPLEVGDAVRKNQLIAELDPTDSDLDVQYKKALLAKSNADVRQSYAELERNLVLYEAGNVSQSDFDSVEATYLTNKAQHLANQKDLALTKQNLAYTRIYAPQNGIITEKSVKDYQTVSQGEVIYKMANSYTDSVELGIPIALITQIEKGKPATVTFENIPGKTYQAKVSDISIVPGDTTVYSITVDIASHANAILPGWVADVAFNFNVPVSQQFVLVPNEAIQSDPDKSKYVWIFNPAQSNVQRQPVKIGKLMTEGMQVTEGLLPGQLVVTRGGNTLTENLKVDVAHQG